MIKGKAIRFGDNVDTDQIIAACHLTLPTISDMAVYTFEHYPEFRANFQQGDIIVGGKNFGCGSSREQAPAVLKEMGVQVIVAESFARIFYRNAINLGLMLIECDEAGNIENLDELTFSNNTLSNTRENRSYSIQPFPDFVQEIFEQGGIVGKLVDC